MGEAVCSVVTAPEGGRASIYCALFQPRIRPKIYCSELAYFLTTLEFYGFLTHTCNVQCECTQAIISGEGSQILLSPCFLLRYLLLK